MPCVKRSREREESDNEENEQDSDSDRSSDDDSSSTDPSDSEDSSELDDEECERRRGNYLTDISDLERQYSLLKEQLYQERSTDVNRKLEEVKDDKSLEYLLPLEELREEHKVRLEVSAILRRLCLQTISCSYEADLLGCKQNFENEKDMLWDAIEGELEDKIRRLEEDRNNVDVTSLVWVEQNLSKKTSRSQQGSLSPVANRRRRPTTISGPYIIYMLKEPDIMDDWTAIKKALTASKRKSKFQKLTASPRHISDSSL